MFVFCSILFLNTIKMSNTATGTVSISTLLPCFKCPTCQLLLFVWTSIYYRNCLLCHPTALKSISLTVDAAARICCIMSKRLPQISLLTVHLCAHCDRIILRQETPFNADLFIYERTNRSGCQQRALSKAALPPNFTY